MSEEVAPHTLFQYSDSQHQSSTAVVGMWLFLATEVLFFGGLILAWVFSRHWQQQGFDAGSRGTLIAFGTTNLALLVTSSFVYSAGLAWIRLSNARRLAQCCWVTAAIGLLFLVLKLIEWYFDTDDGWFPTGDFRLAGALAGGARLFWSFYFVATALHAVHLAAGIGLVGWVAWLARHGSLTARWHTPAEVVGLYWGFVDIVWIVLFPLIYLIGRSS